MAVVEFNAALDDVHDPEGKTESELRAEIAGRLCILQDHVSDIEVVK